MPGIPQSFRQGLIFLVLLGWLLPLAAIAEVRAPSDAGVPANQRSVSEARLAAALTLRIAKFIKWPDRPTITSDKPYFIVGVMGSHQTESAFTQFDGKLVKGLTIKTVRVTPATDLRELRRCHVFFVDATADREVIAEMVQQSRGILTAFGPNGAEHGDPCLRLVKRGDTFAFDINLQCTRRAGLDVDAGLINLARRVKK